MLKYEREREISSESISKQLGIMTVNMTMSPHLVVNQVCYCVTQIQIRVKAGSN